MPKPIIYQLLPRYFGNECRNHVHNGSIEQNGCGKFNDITKKALEAIKGLGVTHVWFTGVLEHATQTDYSSIGIDKDHPAVVKGKAGSPYAIKDYYDVDPDLAVDPENRMKEFANLIRRTHTAGLKVIIDFIPNHLAREYHSDSAPAGTVDFGENDRKDWGFWENNNFYYFPGQSFEPYFDRSAGEPAPYTEFPARATGNDCFTPSPSVNDWYETVKLNYGVDYQGGGVQHFDPIPDTWRKMLDVLLYWACKGIDGVRCDMAEMVPAAFWKWVIPQVKSAAEKPFLFIGEVYNPGLYYTYLDAGFDYLYDKVGLYDTLKAIVQGYAPATDITYRWQSLGKKWPHMLNFLENHDEQRIASPFFAGDAMKAFPALVVSACLRGNPFMLYAGQELGEEGMYEEGFSGMDGRSTIFDYWCIDSLADFNSHGKWNGGQLDTKRSSIRDYYNKVLNLCQSEPALGEGLFFDLMYVNPSVDGRFDAGRQYAFLRKSSDTLLLIVVNFDNRGRLAGVRIPSHAFDYLQLPIEKMRDAEAVELLSGATARVPMYPDGLTDVTLPAHGAVIWKYQL